jgi:hypothetical protein
MATTSVTLRRLLLPHPHVSPVPSPRATMRRVLPLMKTTALLLLSLLPSGHQLDESETVQETPVVVSTVSELTKALEGANPGETIYLRGGTYRCPTTMTIARSGSASAPIRLFAYPSDATRPRLNFSTLATRAFSCRPVTGT